MRKNWIKYFLYFFAPMTVVLILWLIFSTLTGGGLSIGEKGAGIALLAFCAILAASCSLWVTTTLTAPTEHLFRAITPRQKNEVQTKLEDIFNSEELPIKQSSLASGEIFAANITIFLGMNERVSLSKNDSGIVLKGPKKLVETIVPIIDEANISDV